MPKRVVVPSGTTEVATTAPTRSGVAALSNIHCNRTRSAMLSLCRFRPGCLRVPIGARMIVSACLVHLRRVTITTCGLWLPLPTRCLMGSHA
jgi:hypothetical protein